MWSGEKLAITSNTYLSLYSDEIDFNKLTEKEINDLIVVVNSIKYNKIITLKNSIETYIFSYLHLGEKAIK